MGKDEQLFVSSNSSTSSEQNCLSPNLHSPKSNDSPGTSNFVQMLAMATENHRVAAVTDDHMSMAIATLTCASSPSASLSVNANTNHSDKVICKKELTGRAKELTIREVIRKVCIWRKLWVGVLENGELHRYSLDDAARKVKMSRKTMDDYLLQLRLGKKFGFDFKSHQNSQIGSLRRHVRKIKNAKKQNKQCEDSI